MRKVTRKAKPETEDFSGKYKLKDTISEYLVNNYFSSVKKLIKEIPQAELNLALEIGCGVGESTKRLKQMLKKSISFDASEYVKKNVEIAKMNNPRIRIIQEDIYELRRKNKSYDLIFLLEVLEHLDDPQAALNELSRVSKKYVIIGVPNEPLWRILNILRGKYLKGFGNTPGHLNHWSPQQLEIFLEKNHIEVIRRINPIPWTIILGKVA